MSQKIQKGYWAKKSETFKNGAEAKTRAANLRSHEHIAHVLVDRKGDEFVVAYSIARFYLEQLEAIGSKP